MEPKFIKLNDIDDSVTSLNICIDSIAKFYHSEEGYFGDEVKKCSHIYLKGTDSYHCVNETPEEIEALINEKQKGQKLVSHKFEGNAGTVMVFCAVFPDGVPMYQMLAWNTETKVSLVTGLN